MKLTVEFHKPEQLADPKPNYQELLTRLNRDLDSKTLALQIAGISAKWATNSGYYFFYGDNDRHFVFVHVSLNPKDFL